MQNKTQKNIIENTLGKKRITKSDAEILVEIAFNSRAAGKLKKYMEDLALQANCSLSSLGTSNSRNQLLHWVSSMLEDL